MEEELQWASRPSLPLTDVTDYNSVSRALADIKMLMSGVGLRTLLEVLQQWPERFRVQRTGPQGATVGLAQPPQEKSIGASPEPRPSRRERPRRDWKDRRA